MHAPSEKSRNSHRTVSGSGVKFLVLPAIVALVLMVLVVVHPRSSVWIAQAVEAEFGGIGFAADMPTETAQPGMAVPMRTVVAY